MAETKVTQQEIASNYLAYATATTDGQVVTSTDITGCAATVIIPTGKTIRISGKVDVYSTTAGQLAAANIQEGTTQLNQFTQNLDRSNKGVTLAPVVILSPTAGTHIYKLSVSMETAAGAISSNTGYPAFILVEVLF